MKKFQLVLGVICILASCTKNQTTDTPSIEPPVNYQKKLTGYWVSFNDTLWIDSVLIRGDFEEHPCPSDPSRDRFYNKYEYTLSKDSIKLQYIGKCRIGLPSYSSSIKYNSDSFFIENSDPWAYTWYGMIFNRWYVKIK